MGVAATTDAAADVVIMPTLVVIVLDAHASQFPLLAVNKQIALLIIEFNADNNVIFDVMFCRPTIIIAIKRITD